jgi:hypothetical protein
MEVTEVTEGELGLGAESAAGDTKAYRRETGSADLFLRWKLASGSVWP